MPTEGGRHRFTGARHTVCGGNEQLMARVLLTTGNEIGIPIHDAQYMDTQRENRSAANTSQVCSQGHPEGAGDLATGFGTTGDTLTAGDGDGDFLTPGDGEDDLLTAGDGDGDFLAAEPGDGEGQGGEGYLDDGDGDGDLPGMTTVADLVPAGLGL